MSNTSSTSVAPDHRPTENESSVAWDAYSIWRDRVHGPRQPAVGPAPPQGWDPYFVWLSRVKKPAE
jgi:hypothetical protein